MMHAVSHICLANQRSLPWRLLPVAATTSNYSVSVDKSRRDISPCICVESIGLL